MRTIEAIKADMKKPCDYTDTCELTAELILALTAGMDISRLEELCQAERENRCVVLPCKVGDVLFVPCVTSVMETTVTSVQFYENCVLVTTKNFNKHGIANTHAFYSRDFGKTVFLTREEAANALKGEGK